MYISEDRITNDFFMSINSKPNNTSPIVILGIITFYNMAARFFREDTKRIISKYFCCYKTFDIYEPFYIGFVLFNIPKTYK